MSCLLTLIILTSCARSPDEKQEPVTRPELAPLLELAKSPEVELDALDAPAAPPGFNRIDVLALANGLIDAVERTDTADPDDIRSERDAVDHTFAALDMRSRVRIAELLEETSRDEYGGMPVDWMLVDRWERGHHPVSPARIIKAAWDVQDDDGFLEVTLQVLQSYVSVRGEPMFIDRTFSLSTQDPSRAPSLQTYFGAIGRVIAVDRCHIVETGHFRPDTRADQLKAAAKAVKRQVTSTSVSPSSGADFRRGCD